LAVGQVSIGGLFMAGIIPGVTAGIAMMGVNYYISRKRNYERRTKPYLKGEARKIVTDSLMVLIMPALIVGGIVTGVYTATESAAVASAYALIIGFIVFRSLKIQHLPDIFINSAKISAIFILLLATSNLFGFVLVTENVPNHLAGFLHSITQNKYVFLLILNILLLVIGCMVDLFPAILIFGPILAPISASYGIDPLHFGVIFCTNLLVGLNTPPVGSGLIIGAAIGGVSVESLVKEMLPFFLIQLLVLLAITYISAFSLFLPRITGF
jgi:tripartite ATP-independent transporter DctM subunit